MVVGSRGTELGQLTTCQSKCQTNANNRSATTMRQPGGSTCTAPSIDDASQAAWSHGPRSAESTQ